MVSRAHVAAACRRGVRFERRRRGRSREPGQRSYVTVPRRFRRWRHWRRRHSVFALGSSVATGDARRIPVVARFSRSSVATFGRRKRKSSVAVATVAVAEKHEFPQRVATALWCAFNPLTDAGTRELVQRGRCGARLAVALRPPRQSTAWASTRGRCCAGCWPCWTRWPASARRANRRSDLTAPAGAAKARRSESGRRAFPLSGR